MQILLAWLNLPPHVSLRALCVSEGVRKYVPAVKQWNIIYEYH